MPDRYNSLSTNYRANLPASIYYCRAYKTMDANRPGVLSNIANASKRFFRFTVDIIERAVRRILGKDTTGPSSIQKAISIRTITAKDMLHNASLPLGGNQNVRAHRAHLEDMLDIYQDATVAAFYSLDDNLPTSTSYSYDKLSPDNKNKCVLWDILPTFKTSTLTRYNRISHVVDSMISDISNKKQKEFRNNKEIKIIVEAPPFIVHESQSLYTNKDYAKEYITACEAWQLYLQIQYNKKVTILPFRPPENINNENHVQCTKDNNNAYDSANAELAKINKIDRVRMLLQYIEDHIANNQKDQLNTYYDFDNQYASNSTLQSLTTSYNNLSAISYEEDDIDQKHTSLSTTDFYDPTIQDTKKVLEKYHTQSKGSLNEFLCDIKGYFVRDNIRNNLSAPTSNFSDLKINFIKVNPILHNKIDNTNIYKNLTVRCYNDKDREQQKSKVEITLSDIDKYKDPEHQGYFFLNLIEENPLTLVQPKTKNIEYNWSLYLNDFQDIAEFSKENHVDAGEATLMYLKVAGKNIFNKTELDNYIDGIKDVLREDIKEYLQVDTTNKDPAIKFSACTIDLVVDLIFPQDFLDAIENSKNPTISSLVKKYGAANVLLNSLKASQDYLFIK